MIRSTRAIWRVAVAAFFLIVGAVTLIFRKNDYRPIYRGLRYFLEHPSYQQTLRILRNDPAFMELVRTRYRAGQGLDWDLLKSLPPGTLGREYADFMGQPQITALQDLPESSDAIDAEIDYMRARIRFTHDIHHLVLGFPATALGEMAISAYYIAQIRSPLNAMVLAVGLIKTTLKYPEHMNLLLEAIVLGWNVGQSSKPIFGIKWEEMWDQRIAEIGGNIQAGELGRVFFESERVRPTHHLT